MIVITTAQIVSIVVFVVVMAFVASGKIHRAVAALAGAMFLIVAGIVTWDGGLQEIDFNTIGVLVGMMLFVAVVRESGLFEFMAIKSAKLAKGNPWMIMIAFCVITAILSALLDNVTTVLLVGPMTMVVCDLLEVNPVPYFLTEIMASNVGGTATLIGDPPNIMIGSAAQLDFFDFIAVDAPIVVVIMIVMMFCFKFMYGRKMVPDAAHAAKVMELNPHDYIKNPRLFKQSIAMILILIVLFMLHGQLHLESCVIALSAAAVMLIISRQDLEKAITHVEWSTIGFFCGLFIVVGGLAETGVIGMIADWIVNVTADQPLAMMLIVLWVSAVVSAILDNIPFVATMIPVITAIGATGGVDVMPLWWALSLGACLGGNGTLVGASANVVLASISSKHGHEITFGQFTKVGFPIMIVTVAIASVYLFLRFGLAML